MGKALSLIPVTYARSYQSERAMPITLVGNSGWLRDIELVLEDKWPNLRQEIISPNLGESFASFGSGLALVEATQDIDQIKVCTEALIPPLIKKVIIIRESENLLIKKAYSNYCARAGLILVELPDNSQPAADELSGLFGTFLSQIRNDLEDDIGRAEFILDGFSIKMAISSLDFHRWDERAEAVLTWIFPIVTLETTEYRLLRVLVRAAPIFSLQEKWPSSVSETLLPLQAIAQSNKVKDFLALSLAMVDNMQILRPQDLESLTMIIKQSNVGLLTKRVLIKNLAGLGANLTGTFNQKKVA